MGPLGKSKAAGVAETIKQMTEELAGVMARTCSPDIRRIDAGVIWRKGF